MIHHDEYHHQQQQHGGEEEGDEMIDLDNAPVTQEDGISAYFEENCLVRQQLDSFDETASRSYVDDSLDIRLIKELQYLVGYEDIFDDGIDKDNQQKVFEI